MAPQRIQRKRAKGWRMPDNTVVVSRPTAWGNPFVVGRDGTQAECVDLFRALMAGYLCISKTADCVKAQETVLAYVAANIRELAGKNLACWCRVGTPCHADVLLDLANSQDQK